MVNIVHRWLPSCTDHCDGECSIVPGAVSSVENVGSLLDGNVNSNNELIRKTLLCFFIVFGRDEL